jgi:hypothetical protein
LSYVLLALLLSRFALLLSHPRIENSRNGALHRQGHTRARAVWSKTLQGVFNLNLDRIGKVMGKLGRNPGRPLCRVNLSI